MFVVRFSVFGSQCNRCANRNFCITLNAADCSNPIIHIRVLNAIDLNADDLNAVIIEVLTSLIRVFQRKHKGAEAGGLKGQGAILIADNIQFFHGIVVFLVEHLQCIGSERSRFFHCRNIRQFVQTRNR